VVAASYIFHGNPLIPTMGASGAIFGLLLAFGIIFAESTILVFFFFPMAAKYAVMIYGALELYFTVQSPGDGVSHVAHLSGMAFGYIYIKTKGRGRSKPSAPVFSTIGDWYKRRKLDRAKRKFEVYMKHHRDQ
jgi:membrane associated rhomboid family serine protease